MQFSIKEKSMTHNIDYRQCALILQAINRKQHRSYISPSHSNLLQNTFSSLNLISQIVEKPKTLTKNRPLKQNKIKQKRPLTCMNNNNFQQVKFQQLQRPKTSQNLMQKQTASNQNRTKDQINLFQQVRKEKLKKLAIQKQELMEQIFNQDNIFIHRYDEDEQIAEKPNALNFKTYQSLNKLMKIRDQIFTTTNRRPKTGGQRFPIKKVLHD